MRFLDEVDREYERARQATERVQAQAGTDLNLFGLGMLQGYLRALAWVLEIDDGKANVVDECAPEKQTPAHRGFLGEV